MKASICCAAVVLCLVFLGGIEKTEAANCSVAELSPCMNSVLFGTPPTPECCQKAKEQEPCFCQYINDPTYGPIMKGPNARKTVEACGLKWPTC